MYLITSHCVNKSLCQVYAHVPPHYNEIEVCWGLHYLDDFQNYFNLCFKTAIQFVGHFSIFTA